MKGQLSKNLWLFPYFYFEEKYNEIVFLEDKSLPLGINTRYVQNLMSWDLIWNR